MNPLTSSSIARKYAMGIAGLVWTFFVLGHMLGNFFILGGAEAYNKYGHAIVSNKPLLYGTEAALILSILVHAILGVLLARENRKASPSKYHVAPKTKKGSWAAKTMVWQGSLILAFVIYHLYTFKYGNIYYVTYDGVEMRDLHRLLIEVFAQPMYVVGYLISLVVLGFHLSHGFGSAFQSLGLNHPKYTPMVKTISWVYGIVVAGGFIIQPIYIYLLYKG